MSKMKELDLIAQGVADHMKELFEIMFGKEFMESNDKGQIREYNEI